MKNRFLILAITIFLSVPATVRAENFNPFSKDNACLTLTLFMKLELESQRVPFINVSCDVHKKHEPVSSIILNVVPQYRDTDPFKSENIAIMVQAVRGVGDITTSSDWDSRYFMLVISKSGSAKRLAYIFSTDECRTYYHLLSTQGPENAAYFLSEILPDAMERAQQ